MNVSNSDIFWTLATLDLINDEEVEARDKKLFPIVNELLETEKTYVRTLRLLAVVSSILKKQVLVPADENLHFAHFLHKIDQLT